MNVIKNFKSTGEKFEEFPFIKIKEDEDVYAELPLCQMPFNTTFEKPILFFTPKDSLPTAMSLDQLKEKIKNTKIFHLKRTEGDRLTEVTAKQAELSYRLPADTPVDQLAIVNGQLGLLEESDKAEEVKEEEEVVKTVAVKEDKTKE